MVWCVCVCVCERERERERERAPCDGLVLCGSYVHCVGEDTNLCTLTWSACLYSHVFISRLECV